MASIRDYIRTNLLSPLKQYPTVIQETMVEYIITLLESLYDYTVAFPDIVSPNSSRLDILKVIAEQFSFSIRDDADLQEQINILENILTVYSKRGSIDTIENMWKYYGGELPKDVKVIIPSYDIFKYNKSKYSSSHVFQDGNTYRNGVYEIKITNNTYPIAELKEFMIKELVAAGNFIYFSNALRLDLLNDADVMPYKYDVLDEILLNLELPVSHSYQGLYLDGPESIALSGQFNETLYNYHILTEEQRASEEYRDIVNLYNLMANQSADGVWSGKENIYIDICSMLEIESHDYYYDVNTKCLELIPQLFVDTYYTHVDSEELLTIEAKSYCTPSSETTYISRDLYNDKGEHVIAKEYFILGESLLGESLGYELASEEII